MKELKKQWKNREWKKCYLFYGTETYLIKNYEKALTDSLLPEGTELMNYDLFEEKAATAEAIASAADTMPFLNEKRMIAVRNSGFFQKGAAKEEGEKLVDIIEQLSPDVCLLFVEEKAEKNTRLYKAVAKYGEVIAFDRPKENELVDWIKKELAKNGLSVANKTVQFFLQTVDNDMENIHGELEKLAAYLADKKTVTIENIQAVCTPSLEAKVFELVKAVAERKPDRAVTIYRNLLTLRESPYMVLSLLTRQFRMILLSTLFSEENRLTNGEIAQRLEIKDFAAAQYIRQGKNMPIEQWKRALKDSLETDIKIKTGEMGEELAVELLILKYSSSQLSQS